MHGVIQEDKVGIYRYFTPDLENPIDQEIVNRIKSITRKARGKSTKLTPIGEEYYCRLILTKRLGCRNVSTYGNRNGITNEKIFLGIKTRCKMHNKSWNDVVRELFCIEFNIKKPTVNGVKP